MPHYRISTERTRVYHVYLEAASASDACESVASALVDDDFSSSTISDVVVEDYAGSLDVCALDDEETK